MAFQGSFLGFSYSTNASNSLIHSSTLGIVRTSNGDRFDDALTASFKDITSTVEGADGSYYFGTNYQTKQFTLSFAFDSVTDSQLRQMRQLFGEKGIHKLVLDEFPYKAYYVKPSTAPQLKYVAFATQEGKASYTTSDDLYGVGTETNAPRVYRGEGSISFIAYQPFAMSVHKYSNEYSGSTLETLAGVSLKASNYTETISGVTYTIDQAGTGGIMVYNPGDLDTPFKLMIKPTSGTSVAALTVSLGDKELELKAISLMDTDAGYLIDTKLHIVQGFTIVNNEVQLTGTLYNQYITGGDFFKIPTSSACALLEIECATSLTPTIDYSYLYY